MASSFRNKFALLTYWILAVLISITQAVVGILPKFLLQVICDTSKTA